MRLLAGNLRQGGAGQVAALSHRLSLLSPDVVVLGEYGHGSGPVLASLLDSWPHVAAGESIDGDRGVAVLSRGELIDARPARPFPNGRCAYADLSPSYGLSVLGVYAPIWSDRRVVAGFWEAVLAAVHALAGRPLAILGDFDLADSHARALRQAGFTDARNHQPGEEARQSSHHPLWLSPPLIERPYRCWYDHGWRAGEAGSPPISDHSALVCDLDP